MAFTGSSPWTLDREPGLAPWGQLLFDLVAFESDVFGQAAFDRVFYFAFDQGAGVGDELVVRQETVFRDPVARDEMLDIGDVGQGLKSGAPPDLSSESKSRTIFTIEPLWPPRRPRYGCFAARESVV